MKKVLIVDDHYVIRAGTMLILHSNIKDLDIDQASCFLDALELVKQKQYDLILLDIDLPDTQNKKMVSAFKSQSKDLKILMYTSYSDQEIAIQYIKEGADGFLNKMAGEKDIVKAVNDIFCLGYYYPPALVGIIVRQIHNPHPIEKLSQREREIFELLAQGNGNLEISNLLGIKATTISTYKKRIFEKLNIENIMELMEIKKNIH